MADTTPSASAPVLLPAQAGAIAYDKRGGLRDQVVQALARGPLSGPELSDVIGDEPDLAYALSDLGTTGEVAWVKRSSGAGSSHVWQLTR